MSDFHSTTNPHQEEELENALNKGALWAVTYGDMMSYLMIFFLVLFSLYASKSNLGTGQAANLDKSLVQIQKVFGGTIDPKTLERIQQLENEESLAYKLKQSQESADMGALVQIQSNEENIRLVLPESISFDSGKAELKDEAKSILRVLAALIESLPNKVVIEGHTDNVPIQTARYPNNFFLSSARSFSVMEYLKEQGVSIHRLSGQGYADHQPVTSNATAEGRAKNRRVEVVLVRSR